MGGRARGCIASLVSLAILASARSASADGVPSEAAPTRAWPAMVSGAAPLRLDSSFAPTPPILSTPVLSTPIPRPTPPWTNARLDKGEKIILIVAVCVVGALLLFATVKIASHNDPF